MQELMEIVNAILDRKLDPKLNIVDIKKLKLLTRERIVSNKLSRREISKATWIIRGLEKGYFYEITH